MTRAATISRVLISNNAKIYSRLRNAVSTVIKSHAKARFVRLSKNGIQVSSNLQIDGFDRVVSIFLNSPLIRRAATRDTGAQKIRARSSGAGSEKTECSVPSTSRVNRRIKHRSSRAPAQPPCRHRSAYWTCQAWRTVGSKSHEIRHCHVGGGVRVYLDF